MKCLMVFFFVIILTSCHLNDTRTEIHRAKVSIKNKIICITLPDSKDESIIQSNINEIGNDRKTASKHIIMTTDSIVEADQCLPNYGFYFEKGRSYVFSVDTIKVKEGRKIKNGNSYNVTFSVEDNEGELSVENIN